MDFIDYIVQENGSLYIDSNGIVLKTCIYGYQGTATCIEISAIFSIIRVDDGSF